MLGHFGVTPAMITECQSKIDAFSASIGQRESSAAERVGARANLLEVFDGDEASACAGDCFEAGGVGVPGWNTRGRRLTAAVTGDLFSNSSPGPFSK